MTDSRIVRLGAHPEFIPVFAQAYETEWPEWYGADGPGDATSYLRDASRDEGLPAGFVALVDDAPAGTVILGHGSAVGAAYPGPWISSLFVMPAFRERGLAMQLIAAAEAHAQAAARHEVYIGVTKLEAAMLRRDYVQVCRETHGGEDVAILRKTW